MDVFIARQPIFDRSKRVVAYELLFRQGMINAYENSDADQATLDVINNGFLLIGMGNLTGNKKAFINFTSTLLKKGVVLSLSKELVVVEILEDVVIDEELIECCRTLKDQGYTLALDDFVFKPEYLPLMDLIDIIKVDFTITTGSERFEILKKFDSGKIKFLAEKVETHEEFKEALRAGYSYFQGYFFSKPVILSTKNVQGNRLSHLGILQELSKPEIDFVKIEELIKKDVSLSYKLLRFINSAAFGFRTKVESIKHALTLLGENELARWAYIVALKDICFDKPDELIITSIIRAKFGELIAGRIGYGNRAQDIFLMGMLSMIDTITGMPMETILEELPISEDIKKALLGQENTFSEIYELLIAYETGEWTDFMECSQKLGFGVKDAPQLYLKSIEWADEFYHFQK